MTAWARRLVLSAAALLWSTSAVTIGLPPRDVLEVQMIVQERVTYVEDTPGVDHWRVAIDKGDCEDFALAKRAELIRRGYGDQRLQVLMARSRAGNGHAVLLVDGQWVLDNTVDMVLPMRLWTENWTVVCVIQDITTEIKAAIDRC